VTRTTTKTHRFSANGDRIRRARKRAGISQEALALNVGTTRRHMIRLENGEHLPGTPLRNRIASAVGVDPSAIQASDEDDEESDTVSLETAAQGLVSALTAEIRRAAEGAQA
jgi:transcriptional regulator with XRE-family HTH domain